MSDFTVCERCGVGLSSSSMKFHAQVCGKSTHDVHTKRNAVATHLPESAKIDESRRDNYRRENLNALREEIYGKRVVNKPVVQSDQQQQLQFREQPSKTASPIRRIETAQGLTSQGSLGKRDASMQQYAEQVERQLQELRRELRDQRTSVSELKSGGELHLLQRDLLTLGRHVDALRDEVEACRAEILRMQDENRRQDVQALVAQPESSSELKEIRYDVQQLARSIELCKSELLELRKERDVTVVLRRDLKYVSRETDSLHGEICDLRRQMEKDRQRTQEIISQRIGAMHNEVISPRAYEQRYIRDSPVRETTHVVGGTSGGKKFEQRNDKEDENSDASDDVAFSPRHRETEHLVRRAIHSASGTHPTNDAYVSRVSLRNQQRRRRN